MPLIEHYWSARLVGSADPEERQPRTRQRRMKDTAVGFGIGVAQAVIIGTGLSYGLQGWLAGIGAEIVVVGGFLIWRLHKQQQQILQIQATLDRAIRYMTEASPYALVPGPKEQPYRQDDQQAQGYGGFKPDTSG